MKADALSKEDLKTSSGLTPIMMMFIVIGLVVAGFIYMKMRGGGKSGAGKYSGGFGMGGLTPPEFARMLNFMDDMTSNQQIVIMVVLGIAIVVLYNKM